MCTKTECCQTPLNSSGSVRYDWVDVLKFLGIFAIYLGHFSQAAGKFYLFVFTYHVHLFFFAGGFFHKTPKLKDLGSYVISKFKRIMIPYFICMAVTIATDYLLYNIDLTNALYEALLGRRNHIGSPWFLTAFFTTVIIYTLLNLIFRNKYIVLVIAFLLHAYYYSILSALNIEPLSIFWNLDSDINYIFYYALGHCIFPLLQKLEWKKGMGLCKNWAFLLIALLSGAVTGIVFIKGSDFVHALLPIPDVLRIRQILIVLTMIIFNCIIAHLLSEISILQKLGKSTLVLCGYEKVAKCLVTSALAVFGLTTNLNNPVTTLLYTALCLMVCYIVFEKFAEKYFPPMAGFVTSKKKKE